MVTVGRRLRSLCLSGNGFRDVSVWCQRLHREDVLGFGEFEVDWSRHIRLRSCRLTATGGWIALTWFRVWVAWARRTAATPPPPSRGRRAWWGPSRPDTGASRTRFRLVVGWRLRRIHRPSLRHQPHGLRFSLLFFLHGVRVSRRLHWDVLV